MRKFGVWTGVVLLVAVVIAAVGALVDTAGSKLNELHVSDTVHVVALEVHRELLTDPDGFGPEEIRQMLVNLDSASVSNVWFDEAGTPLDAWGTPFRVTHDDKRPVGWVLCESAGPDGEFGTEDDLSYRSEK